LEKFLDGHTKDKGKEGGGQGLGAYRLNHPETGTRQIGNFGSDDSYRLRREEEGENPLNQDYDGSSR